MLAMRIGFAPDAPRTMVVAFTVTQQAQDYLNKIA